MAKPTHELSVKAGSYQARDGTTKANWVKIGTVFAGIDGGTFLTINRTFNPAGMPIDGRDAIAVSVFKIKDDQTPQAPIAPVPAINKSDDDIPF